VTRDAGEAWFCLVLYSVISPLLNRRVVCLPLFLNLLRPLLTALPLVSPSVLLPEPRSAHPAGPLQSFTCRRGEKGRPLPWQCVVKYFWEAQLTLTSSSGSSGQPCACKPVLARAQLTIKHKGRKPSTSAQQGDGRVERAQTL
jgi:hypothetical protein